MFVASDKFNQLSLFDSAGSSFKGKTLRQYEAVDAWQNLFRRTITLSIDEHIFKSLYCMNNGCPNASIRVLIAMMILKESQGLSDAKLFEECRYNAITRSALGLMNWDDPVPVESTYYLFRQQIQAYALGEKGDLMELMFTDLATKHCHDFEVSGKRIRMDSKLLGSNIAWLSRYELVHQTIYLFCKSIGSFTELDQALQTQLSAILEVNGAKITYKYSSEEVKTKLQELGELIGKLLPLFSESGNTHYSTLVRVFNEQFELDESKNVMSRPSKDISASSVQSPHDTDATYRNKNGNKVKGNVCNVTETCNDLGLNLIVNVDTRPVTTSDVDFLEKGVNQANAVTNEKVEIVHADGAYNSTDNQKFCKDNSIELTLHAIQGKPSCYLLTTTESGDLAVIVKETGESIETTTTLTSKDGSIKWRIKVGGKYRYFSQKDIDGQKLREKIAKTPTEELQKRNNVEATIFQLGYHYPNAKSRYRGLVKHKMWANIRCVWVNFVRIANYLAKQGQKLLFLLFTIWKIANNRLKRGHAESLNAFLGKQNEYAGNCPFVRI